MISTRPETGKMYGLTHTPDGKPIVREPRTIKVGIGLLKGKEIHVYMDLSRKWVVQVGKEVKRFDSKLEARKHYRASKPNAPERRYPSRLPYFTFSHMGPDGYFEPDWEIIEAHGPIPTELDVVFVRDDPFQYSYQLWTATEKKCDGDGINAMRIISMANSAAERKLAEQAAQEGERAFPIVNGCWTRGCPYAQPQGDKPSPCRPHGRLRFQLLNSPVLGGTAEFLTSGFRSIQQIFSCLEIFRSVSGGGNPDVGYVAGIPLKMVLRPYRTSHNGKATTQYGVSLELRADSAVGLKRKLIQAGQEFRSIAPESKAIAAAIEAQAPELPDAAAAMAAEFDVVELPEDEFPEAPQGDDQAEIDPADDPLAPEPQDPLLAPKLASTRDRQSFYDLCRSRGMSDAVIKEQLGHNGFETIEEITESALAGLMQWAGSWSPNQKSLLG